MQITSVARSVAGVVACIVLGSSLAGCGEVAAQEAGGHVKSQQTLQKEAEVLFQKAEVYAGDPWEARFREQFWSGQHVHDSWNRCHLGENAPRPRRCDGTSLTPRP
jgi:hypothetical protein